MINSLEGALNTLSVQQADRDLGGLEKDVADGVSAIKGVRGRAAAARPFGVAGVLAALALGLAAGGTIPRSSARASDLDIFSARATLAPSTLLNVDR